MPSCRAPRCVFIATAMLLLLFVAAVAQVNTASVRGTVTDSTGASVPNAEIRLVNEGTSAVFNTQSSNAGEFTFNFIPLGNYTLTARAAGFGELTRTGIQLAAGDNVTLEVPLKVQTAQQSVVVTAEAPLVESTTSEQHATITEKQVRELPLAKRDWSGTLALNNGVTLGGNSNTAVSLNGLPPSGFNLTVDGTNASVNPEVPSIGFYQGFNVINTVNSEALQEVSITKGIAPATVGGSMSGNINLITKGGTNEFHGSLFEYNSLSAYSARNQFSTSNTKPRTEYNQFGGALGGRLIKDKLFFFGDVAYVRSLAFQSLTATVPTAEFAASIIQAAPVFRSVLSIFPLPNTPYAAGAQTAQYLSAGSAPQNDENAIGRLDWLATAHDMLTVRYSRSRPERTTLRIPDIDNRLTTGHNSGYNGQYTHSGTSWAAVTRFGYNYVYLNRLDQNYSAGIDQVTFGFNSLGGESFQIFGGTITAEETIAINRGHHAMQIGGVYQRQRSGRIDLNTNGFSYASLADLLANIPNTVTINFPVTQFTMHESQFGGYFQDDYRILPNLTLNIGVRYDYFTVPDEASGRLFNRAPTALGPGTGPFLPVDSIYKADYSGFAPRLGFAYSIGPDRKTVIRGGAGKFVSQHPIYGGPIDLALIAGPTPARVTYSRAQALALGLTYPANSQLVLAQLQAAGAPVTAPSTINPNFPNPYSLQWTLDVQRQLAGDMVVDVAYVGNRGLHENMIRTSNLPDRVTGVVPDPLFGQFRYYDGSDNSKYNALQTSLQKRFSAGLIVTVGYTYSNNMSLGDADLQLQTPTQDNNNLRSSWGPTPYDQRHSFRSSFLYEAPVQRYFHLNSRAARLALTGWQVSGILTAGTGFPVNIVNSKSGQPVDRPDVVAGVSPTLANYTSTLQYLNPAAFSVEPISKVSGLSIAPGDLGRNAIRAPGFWNLDSAVNKTVALTERVRLQIRADAFNTFNHTNLSGLVVDISKSNFGQLTSAASRTLQLGAKLVF